MLGLGTSLIKGGKVGRAYVKDGLKLYMPYRGSDAAETQFVGTGSTSFDGDNDYIDCGDDTSLDITGAITVMCWVKPMEIDALSTLVGRNDGTNSNYYLDVNTDEKFYWNCRGLTDTSVNSTTTFSAGTWYHVAGVYDGANLILYVNGVAEDTDASTGSIDNDDVSLSIGAREGGLDRFFKGHMKNVAIWSRALTATEVQNVMYKSYAEVSGRLADGLVSWWALDASSLGSDLSTNNTAVSDGLTEADSTTGWDAYDGSSLTSVSTSPYSGSYYFHCIGNGNRVGAYDTIGGLATGRRYQIVAYVRSSNITDVAFRNDGATFSETISLVADTWTRISTIWDADDGDVFIVITSRNNENASDSLDIDNVSIKEIFTEDLKGSNDGTVYGAVIDEDLYGGDTPVIPRGIDNAPTVQADAIGAGSALFDGNSDYISLGNDSSLQVGTSDFSWCAWVYRTADDDAIFSWGDIASPPAWQLYEGGAELLRLRMDDGGGALNSYSSTALPEDEWVHVCLTMDRDSATGIKMYFNGIDVGVDEDDATGQQLTLSGGSVGAYIGARVGGSLTAHHAGNICQVGLWDAVLTQAQIQSIMEKTYEELTASERTNLVSYWALDESEKALDFIPANVDYVDLGNPTALAITDPAITVSTWCLLDADDDWTHLVMNSDGGSYETGYNIFYRDEKLHFSINHYATNVAYVAFTDYGGGWHHVVGTYDGTNIQIYLDGAAGTSDTYTADIGNLRNTYIGAGYNGGANETWDGKIAKVAIYNTALSAAQVLTQYNLGINGDYSSDSNLAGYWKLDNATTVTDLSGNGNNGTVNGADLVDGYVLDKTSNNNDGTLV